MSATLGTTSKDNSALFYLDNDSDQPIAVQVSLAKREMTLEGVELNSKTSGEFILYPSQLIIPASEKRSVKVTWTGKEVPSKELAYRLISEQLPIDLEKNKTKKASIKILLRYVAALYVGQEDFASAISVDEIKTADKKVLIQVINSGKKHQVLTNLNLKFINEKSKKEILLRGEDLKGMSGENVLAESKRLFSFSQAGKFLEVSSGDKVKVSFDKE
ncbi:MAG: fimbria/pilus periplasmic chaperone [Bacteriovorax sp.]|jgi:fimbrial chaperone protein